MTVMMRTAILSAVIFVSACESTSPQEATSPAPVRLNELQFIGTHNSYHIQPDQAVFDLMRATGYKESSQWTGPRLEAALSFTHPPVKDQLDMGLRMFEFDIHDDPAGGRFAHPGILKALPNDVVSQLPPIDPNGDLNRTGFKVFHTVDTDVRSQCLLLRQCLSDIAEWSEKHPGHMPIFVQLESKESRKTVLADAYTPAEPSPFTEASWNRLHDEILSVFPREKLFLPEDLKGQYSSVNEAVRSEGWPEAHSLAGKVIFMLLDDPEPQDQYVKFTEDDDIKPLLFVTRNEDDPHTAWLMRPKPKRQKIRPLVEAGFLVYTRADAHSTQARLNDYTRAKEALASGAQLISTDFPKPNPELSDYHVSFGGNYVRCNIILRRDGCSTAPQAAEK